MNLGFFTMPMHPIGKDWQQSLREDREAFILADQLGFSEGYVGEHATDPEENITSSALFLATLVDATKRMRLGTGTLNMPNHHPAAIAGNIAMLDHLLGGRFILGISPGALPSDAEAFGNIDLPRVELQRRQPAPHLFGNHGRAFQRQLVIVLNIAYFVGVADDGDLRRSADGDVL